MTGTDIAVILVVLGLGGLAVWVLTRESGSVPPLQYSGPGACQQTIGAATSTFASAKGVPGVQAPPTLSGAACSILQNVGQTLQKAAGEVSKVVAVPVRVVGRASDQFGDLITGAPNCQGSCSTYRTKGEADAAIAKLPTSPINVRACVKSICDKKFSSSPIPDQPMPSNAFASANFFRGKL